MAVISYRVIEGGSQYPYIVTAPAGTKRVAFQCWAAGGCATTYGGGGGAWSMLTIPSSQYIPGTPNIPTEYRCHIGEAGYRPAVNGPGFPSTDCYVQVVNTYEEPIICFAQAGTNAGVGTPGAAGRAMFGIGDSKHSGGYGCVPMNNWGGGGGGAGRAVIDGVTPADDLGGSWGGGNGGMANADGSFRIPTPGQSRGGGGGGSAPGQDLHDYNNGGEGAISITWYDD